MGCHPASVWASSLSCTFPDSRQQRHARHPESAQWYVTNRAPALQAPSHSPFAQPICIIKDFNRNEPHALDEDFTYKRPCGFVLEGRGYQDVTTYTRLYELVLRELAKKDTRLFQALPDNPATITRRGNRRFSRTPADLRKPLALPGGIHAETNLSANDLCESLRTLLGIFSIPLASCTLFLRQDRDA